jgi:hypothetical protein
MTLNLDLSSCDAKLARAREQLDVLQREAMAGAHGGERNANGWEKAGEIVVSLVSEPWPDGHALRHALEAALVEAGMVEAAQRKRAHELRQFLLTAEARPPSLPKARRDRCWGSRCSGAERARWLATAMGLRKWPSTSPEPNASS